MVRNNIALRVVRKVEHNRQWGRFVGVEIMGKGGDKIVFIGVYKVVAGVTGNTLWDKGKERMIKDGMIVKSPGVLLYRDIKNIIRKYNERGDKVIGHETGMLGIGKIGTG